MTVDSDPGMMYLRSSHNRTDTDLDRLFIQDVVALSEWAVRGLYATQAAQLAADAATATPGQLEELTVDAEDLLEDMGFYVEDIEDIGYAIYKEA